MKKEALTPLALRISRMAGVHSGVGSIIKGNRHIIRVSLALVVDGCVGWKNFIREREFSGSIHCCLPVTAGVIVLDHQKISLTQLRHNIFRDQGGEGSRAQRTARERAGPGAVPARWRDLRSPAARRQYRRHAAGGRNMPG